MWREVCVYEREGEKMNHCSWLVGSYFKSWTFNLLAGDHPVPSIEVSLRILRERRERWREGGGGEKGEVERRERWREGRGGEKGEVERRKRWREGGDGEKGEVERRGRENQNASCD